MKLLAIAVVVAIGCKVDGAHESSSPSGSARAPAPAAAAPVAQAPSGSAQMPRRLEDFARERRLRELDRDGDGVISDAERAAARHQRAEDIRQQLDTNHDGKLTIEELHASAFYSQVDPAVDANHDGDISADELEPILVERARRTNR